jgi:hypothetical protein
MSVGFWASRASVVLPCFWAYTVNASSDGAMTVPAKLAPSAGPRPAFFIRAARIERSALPSMASTTESATLPPGGMIGAEGDIASPSVASGCAAAGALA